MKTRTLLKWRQNHSKQKDIVLLRRVFIKRALKTSMNGQIQSSKQPKKNDPERRSRNYPTQPNNKTFEQSGPAPPEHPETKKGFIGKEPNQNNLLPQSFPGEKFKLDQPIAQRAQSIDSPEMGAKGGEKKRRNAAQMTNRGGTPAYLEQRRHC